MKVGKKELGRQAQRIGHYMDQLHCREGYEFTVAYDPDMEGAHALVWTNGQVKSVRFELGPLYFAQDERERNQTLIHEVIHVTQRSLVLVAERPFRSLGKKAYVQAEAAFRQQWESQADHLARCLVDHLPPPP